MWNIGSACKCSQLYIDFSNHVTTDFVSPC